MITEALEYEAQVENDANDVILDYTEWRRTHLPEYDNVEDLLRDAEELTIRLTRLAPERIKQLRKEQALQRQGK